MPLRTPAYSAVKLEDVVISLDFPIVPVDLFVWESLTSVIASITANDMMCSGASVITILTGSGLFLLGGLLAIVISVIANMGIANMAHTGELGAAFRFGEILRIIGSIGWGRYISWYIVLIIIEMLFSVVGMLIALIQILGALAYLLVIAPYTAIFQYRAIGLIYREGI